jgi:hypothetical protein
MSLPLTAGIRRGGRAQAREYGRSQVSAQSSISFRVSKCASVSVGTGDDIRTERHVGRSLRHLRKNLIASSRKYMAFHPFEKRGRRHVEAQVQMRMRARFGTAHRRLSSTPIESIEIRKR